MNNPLDNSLAFGLAPPKNKSDDDNLIPLINIVFLLLIFFLVAGQMHWTGQILAEAPEVKSSIQVDKSILTLAQDRNGQLFFNGDKVDISTLADHIRGALNRQEIAAAPQINLYFDKQQTAKDLIAVLDILKGQGIARITLFALAKEPS